jgi:hypothetical protein
MTADNMLGNQPQTFITIRITSAIHFINDTKICKPQKGQRGTYMQKDYKFSELDHYAQETAALDYYYKNEEKFIQTNTQTKHCYAILEDLDDTLLYSKKGILTEDI